MSNRPQTSATPINHMGLLTKSISQIVNLRPKRIYDFKSDLTSLNVVLPSLNTVYPYVSYGFLKQISLKFHEKSTNLLQNFFHKNQTTLKSSKISKISATPLNHMGIIIKSISRLCYFRLKPEVALNTYP